MLLVRMGLRNLLRQKRRTVFTLLSIIVSVLLLGSSLSLNEGMYANMIDLFTRAYTGHVVIQPQGYLDEPTIQSAMAWEPGLMRTLNAHPAVEGYLLKINASAMVFIDTKTTAVQLVGIGYGGAASATTLARQLSAGRIEDFRPGSLLLGFAAARTLGARPGNTLVVISQGADGSIANALYPIAGIIGNSANDMLANSVFLHLADAQEFLTLQGRVHEIPLILRSQDEAEDTAHTLRLPAGLVALPWWEVQKTFYRTMVTDRRSGLISVYIIIAMAALIVLNTVVMMLLERTAEFGVLSALGTRPVRIFQGIMVEVTVLALIGIAIGEVLNLLMILWLARYGIPMPTEINVAGVVITHFRGALTWDCFVQPAQVVFTAALLVSLWPAWRAARRAPLAAIREG